MAERSPPVVITSRSVQGINTAHELGNVAWNGDGQCLFVRKKGVHIMTPYLVSTLPPPASLADANQRLVYSVTVVNRAKRQAAEQEAEGIDPDAGEEDADEKPFQGRSLKIAKRPVGGEVAWWSTIIEISPESDREREEAYLWADTGDEFNGCITDREATVRKAIWSPSGLSELGGCYIAILLSTGQVSIYAPRLDPASSQWDEIVDLTVLQKSLLIPKQQGDVSVQAMLEMRATCMAWSRSIPLSHESGETGGILAIANRAGKVALWAVDENRQFCRISNLTVSPDSWVTHMSWTDWTIAGEGTYDIQLALAMTDGSIRNVTIRQQVDSSDQAMPWQFLAGEVRILDYGDKRTVTSLVWLDTLLVYTKSKSVHLLNQHEQNGYRWTGLRMLKLHRVGSWANANALGTCVGIELYDEDSLLLTLSSLTRHLIRDIHTCPVLAPLADSLRLSLASRQCFYDYLHGNMYKREPGRQTVHDDVDVTAVTGGETAVGHGWHLSCWVVEPLHLHNLNSSTEGMRYLNFMVADLSGSLGDSRTLSERLEAIINKPLRSSCQSPVGLVTPYILRILSSKEPQDHAQDLMEICDVSVDASQAVDTDADPSLSMALLRRQLWDDPTLNAQRIRLVLALWATTQFPAQSKAFKDLEYRLAAWIRSRSVAAITQWTSTALSALSDPPTISSTSARDRSFLRHLSSQPGNEAKAESIRVALRGMNGDDMDGRIDPSLDEDHCPACKQVIMTDPSGTARCVKGHEWVRCSVTGALVTTPIYRVCNTCPAISLLPKRHSALPIPVGPLGQARDWKRFIWPDGLEKDLVEEVLEAATCCLMCGGRWIRSM